MIYKTRFITILLICFTVFNLIAQEENANANLSDTNVLTETQVVEDNKIYDSTEVDTKAVPSISVKAFLEKNLRFTNDAKLSETSGRINLKFVIEKDGSLSNIKVDTFECLSGCNSTKSIKSLEDEAIRVMQLMPNYTPATINDKVVRSYETQKVSFILHTSGIISKPKKDKRKK